MRHLSLDMARWAEDRMYVPYQTLAVMLLVGLVAGWTAAKVVTKRGMGIGGDVIVGVIGAFIGDGTGCCPGSGCIWGWDSRLPF
jgi:hypothetical protein